MKNYWTYVRRFVTDFDFHGEILNGWCDPSFFLKYPEYQFTGIDKFEDGDALCGEIAGRRLFRVYHTLDSETLAGYANSIPTEFDVRMFATTEDCISFVRENSNLTEEAPGKFLIREAGTDMMGNAVTAQFLTIE